MTHMVRKQSVVAIAGLLCVFAWPDPSVLAAVSAAVPKEAQTAFEKKAYQQVLDELAKLDKDKTAVPDVRRLKIRSLINLGKPKDALDEYDLLAQSLKRDDEPVLREVALGLIVVLVKDMREQMRGAAYTALKEIDVHEAVPLFEDGLSDGSGPVRVLAVEGLGRSEAGRKSKKLRGAIEDQAGLVKARVVKALGRSGDASVLPLIEAAAKDELSPVRIAAYAALIRLGKNRRCGQPGRSDRCHAGHRRPEGSAGCAPDDGAINLCTAFRTGHCGERAGATRTERGPREDRAVIEGSYPGGTRIRRVEPGGAGHCRICSGHQAVVRGWTGYGTGGGGGIPASTRSTI